jgi:manganese/iron transport system ATP-binding protein
MAASATISLELRTILILILTPMLEVHNLSVNYRGIRALDGVSFRLQPGELAGAVGPNGAGKSTLIKALLGLVPIDGAPHRPCLNWHGQPVRSLRQVAAYVPQRSQVDWHYPVTAWQVVLMGRTVRAGWGRRHSRAARIAAEAALRRMDLWDLRDRRIGELSGGQQQRVFLARAIAQDADLFLLDEPLTGVDRKTEAIVRDLLDEWRTTGKMTLVCSHEWGNALNRYDHLLLLNQTLLADGSPMEVMTFENIQRAYGQGNLENRCVQVIA